MNSSNEMKQDLNNSWMLVKSHYNQNPQAVHWAAGVGAVTTMSTGFLSWLVGRPLPKVAKLAVFGLTFVSNLASLSMKDVSKEELIKVAVNGKKIIDDTKAAMTSGLVELYVSIVDTQLKAAEEAQPADLNSEGAALLPLKEQCQTETLGESENSADNN